MKICKLVPTCTVIGNCLHPPPSQALFIYHKDDNINKLGKIISRTRIDALFNNRHHKTLKKLFAGRRRLQIRNVLKLIRFLKEYDENQKYHNICRMLN
jgi:ABC-type oligopeptide transport system ATPase subunit